MNLFLKCKYWSGGRQTCQTGSDEVQQFLAMMKELNLSIAPQNVAAIPPPAKQTK